MLFLYLHYMKMSDLIIRQKAARAGIGVEYKFKKKVV
jgi:hypothetical protein